MQPWIYIKYFFRRFCRYRRGCTLLFVVSLVITMHNQINLTYISSSLSPKRMKRQDVQETMHRKLLHYSDQICVHPQLELFPPEFKEHFFKIPRLDCNSEENWVFVDNGTFRISPKAEQFHGRIVCQYVPIFRGPDDYRPRDGKPIKPMLDGTKLLSDFFKVICVSARGRRYVNVHSGIAYDTLIHERLSRSTEARNGVPKFDVLMLGFDSLSRMTWERLLPESHKYFTKHLGGVILEGYNIVGDGTPQALLPILTGKSEQELPEARRGQPGAQTVDQFPWIWKWFRKHGYVTQWVEDMVHIGTFQYRMMGFEKQPTDHYMRPFYLVAQKIFSRFHKLCLGSLERHVNLFNWIHDMYSMYSNNPKFMFGFHSETSHEDNNNVQIVDKDLKNFLSSLFESGSLNRTILILMSDHGARFNKLRSTVQGKLEERMPYFGIRLPPSIDNYYPNVTRNLHTNAVRLTTPFDIYATFQDILAFKEPRHARLGERGISLFKEIPKERSCKDAHIEPHWCACLSWTKVNINDLNSREAILATIARINSLTSKHRGVCARLVLGNVTRVVKYTTNSNVLRYRQSADIDGREADLTDNMTNSNELYQVTFHTVPGDAHFEATVTYHLAENRFEVSEREISRINKYGMDPHCVMDNYPHLRPYCYCKSTRHIKDGG